MDNNASNLYWQASSRLLERSAKVKPIPNKTGGSNDAWRKHHASVLEVALDIQAVVDAAMVVVGDSDYSKELATLATDATKIKAKALQKIAACAPNQEVA